MSEVPLHRYALLRNYDVFVEKTELESLGELRSSWKKVTSGGASQMIYIYIYTYLHTHI